MKKGWSGSTQIIQGPTQIETSALLDQDPKLVLIEDLNIFLVFIILYFFCSYKLCLFCFSSLIYACFDVTTHGW